MPHREYVPVSPLIQGNYYRSQTNEQLITYLYSELLRISDTVRELREDVEHLTEAQESNLLIDGQFEFWQEHGTTVTAPLNGAYVTGMLRLAKIGTAVLDVTRSSDTPDASPARYSVKVDVTTADTSLAAADYGEFFQPIEGLLTKQTLIGTSAAKKVTFSFWVKTNKAGTYCTTLRDAGAGAGAQERTYINEYTITASEVNTWKLVTHTFTVDTSNTAGWREDENIGFYASWCLASGSNLSTSTAREWLDGNFIATTNQVNFFDSTSNEIYLTDIRLDIGEERKVLERGYIFADPRLNRYVRTSYGDGVTVGTADHDGLHFGHTSGGGNLLESVNWETPMRAAPALTLYNSYNGNSGVVGIAGLDSTPSSTATTTTGFRFSQGGVTADAEVVYQYFVNARL